MKIAPFSCFVAMILIVTCCNFTCNNNENQQIVDSIIVTDSIGQKTWNNTLDSMLQVAATAKQDTLLAELYCDIGDMYLDNDPQKAKEYFFKSKALSEKLDWNKGHYLFAICYTDILNREGLMDSSIVIFQHALELAKKDMNEQWIAKISANIGNCYNYKKWFETALKYYNEAIPMFEKKGDKFRLAHLYYLIGTVYNDMKMYDEEFTYCGKALEILNERPDTLVRAYALINYAVALSNKQRLEEAENCLLEAQRICTLHNSRYSLISIYSNLAEIALQKYDLAKMEMYARKSLEICLEFGDAAGYCIINRALAYLQEYKGNFDKAEEFAREALKTAIEFDLPVEKMKIYSFFSDLSTARHDFRNYRFYEAKADSIRTVFMSELIVRSAKEMQAKYETEKKELKISALEEEKRLVIWLSITGGVVLLLALATFFFLWRWTIQKKRIAEQQRLLAEQQVIQLEQERQLVATQSVLDGETRERARLARDLHDGLGSILTGAKLNLMEMKKGVKSEYADKEHFDKTLVLLDESIREMRRVAHHLMPDSLSRFGLKAAVSDFCSNLPSVRFAYYGEESRLEPKLEAMIYRSVHELVNNALKHSEANNIIVQIIKEDDRIAFTVQDDGRGFDPSAVNQGMGLQNIRTRVDSYNGIFDIDSRTGEGTEINVEIQLKNTN